MALAKLRELATYGILTDLSPYDLPPQAFSGGVNVRFSDGCIQRAPVFKNAGALSNANPRSVFCNTTVNGDDIYVAYLSGRVKKWTPTSETDFSISGYSDTDGEGTFTSCVLSECVYVNREERVPWVLTPTATAFVPLPNWTSTWRARIFRSFNSALVALNMTKGAQVSPTMVNVSAPALDGAVPATWDPGDDTANTYENVIAEMRGEIVEAQTLRDALMIYSSQETWAMSATGDTDIYAIRNVFKDRGCINANCAVEVDGVHYVFGPNDIWRHDGITPESLVDKRVRKFVFGGMDSTKTNRCYVEFNPALRTVGFCYVSGDRFTTFIGGEGCNRAAVFNLVDKTWTFEDRPLTFSSTFAGISTTPTWETIGGTWDTSGASWLELQSGTKRGALAVGETSGSLTATLYGHDLFGEGAVFTFPVVSAANPPAQLEHTGIDLDEVGEELRGYKVILSIYPQAMLDASGADLEFAWGSSDGFNVPATYTDFMTYNGDDLYKLDYRNAGRFLAMKMRYADFRTFALSGLDFDLKVHGRR